MAGAVDLRLSFWIPDTGMSEDLLARFMRDNTQVSVLMIANNGDDDFDLSGRVFDALSSNLALRELSLMGVPLGVQNIAAFANLLAHNESIESLSLSACDVDDDGVAQICEALVHNTSLKCLSLTENLLQRGALEALGRYFQANPSLSNLELTDNYGPGGVALAVG